MKVKVTWQTAKCGEWPILWICASAFNPSKVHTHSSGDTHTHCEHTPGAAGSHLCCGTRGAVGGARHLVVVLKVERVLYIHSPPRQSLPDRDLNSQPFNYESDSLPLRPRFAPKLCCISKESFQCARYKNTCIRSSSIILLFVESINIKASCWVSVVLCSGVLQVSGDQHSHRLLHGDGICVWRGTLWLYL